MPNVNDLDRIPKRIRLIIYILDMSESMKGEKLELIKAALVNDFKELNSHKNDDVEFRIQIMTFNSEVKWIPEDGPSDISNIIESIGLLEAKGITNVGYALGELNKKLTRRELLNGFECLVLPIPIIVFVADGYATDFYQDSLNELRKNQRYTHALKMGLALGDDADYSMVKSVTNDDAVHMTVDEFAADCRLIDRIDYWNNTMFCSSGDPMVPWDEEHSHFDDPVESVRLDDFENKNPLFFMATDDSEIPLYEGKNEILQGQIMKCAPENTLSPAFCITVNESEDYMKISNCFVSAFLHYPLEYRYLRVSANSGLAIQDGASIMKDGTNLIFTGIPGLKSEIIIPIDCWDENNLWDTDYLVLDENQHISFRKCDEYILNSEEVDLNWADEQDDWY